MLVRVNGYDNVYLKTKEGVDNDYIVLAISKYRSKSRYLIDINRRLQWFDDSDINILKDDIPKEWINKKFGKFHKLKNTKYNFHIPLEEYHGLDFFMKDIDLFFDILENPTFAYGVYCKYTNKRPLPIFVNNKELCIDSCYDGIGKYVGVPIITILKAMNVDLPLISPCDFGIFPDVDDSNFFHSVKIYRTNNIVSFVLVNGIFEKANLDNAISDLFVNLTDLKSVLSFLGIDAEIIPTSNSIAIWENSVNTGNDSPC